MTVSSDGVQSEASYSRVDDLSRTILHTLQDQSATVGYGMLASALTAARLINHGDILSDDDEVKWLEDFMEWATAYFAPTSEGQRES